jgi:hypothetical protein
MARKKKVITQTLSEFKAWLAGVEELQPEDWAPNKEQWALIRNKINNIAEEAVVDIDTIIETINKNMASHSGVVHNHPQHGMQPQVPQMPALPLGVPPAPPAPAGVPEGPIELSSNVDGPAPAAPSTVGGQNPIDISEVAKPVDTGGKYTSGFG